MLRPFLSKAFATKRQIGQQKQDLSLQEPSKLKIFQNISLKISLGIQAAVMTLLMAIAVPNSHSAPTQTKQIFGFKTFGDWCAGKETLAAETRRTIDALLLLAKTSDCLEAEKQLLSLKEIYLGYSQISDLAPLKLFENVTKLNLPGNQISDLVPLKSLKSLTELRLGGNRIYDLQPLASLSSLTVLELNQNQISDLRPLANLSLLTKISLAGNQIFDISPLKSLVDLTELNLSENRVGDLRPVQSLPKLISLDLRSNPIAIRSCPLPPKSVCRFE